MQESCNEWCLIMCPLLFSVLLCCSGQMSFTGTGNGDPEMKLYWRLASPVFPVETIYVVSIEFENGITCELWGYVKGSWCISCMSAGVSEIGPVLEIQTSARRLSNSVYLSVEWLNSLWQRKAQTLSWLRHDPYDSTSSTVVWFWSEILPHSLYTNYLSSLQN